MGGNFYIGVVEVTLSNFLHDIPQLPVVSELAALIYTFLTLGFSGAPSLMQLGVVLIVASQLQMVGEVLKLLTDTRVRIRVTIAVLLP